MTQPSPNGGLPLQETGENINSWGDVLNVLFQLVEQWISTFDTVAVNADVTLNNDDYVENQSRKAGFQLSGTGLNGSDPAKIICPSGKSRKYLVKNGCANAVVFTHDAGGTDITVAAGKIKWIATDGTDFFTAEEEDYLLLTGGTLTGPLTLSGAPTAALHAATKAYVDTFLSLAGGTMTGFIVLHADPTANNHPATKGYVDGLAFNAIDLPGQAGQAGKFITTDGTSASWAAVPFSSLAGTPTTISGYGITDAFTQVLADARYQPINANLTSIAALTTTARGRLNLTRPAERRVSAATTAAFGDTILGDTTDAAFAVTLPAAVAGNLPITIADDAGNTPTNHLTITPDGSEEINGQTSIEIDQAYRKVVLIPQAGSWRITR